MECKAAPAKLAARLECNAKVAADERAAAEMPVDQVAVRVQKSAEAAALVGLAEWERLGQDLNVLDPEPCIS